MAYSVLAVANAFIELSLRDKEPVTNMKLQKLVYIAQGFSLALRGRPLFDADIRALKWGPVILDLYNAVRHYGNQPIDQKIPLPPSESTIDVDNMDADETVLINFVWNKYKKYTAAQLSAITHRAGTPWSLVQKPDEFPVIPNELIQSHYKEILQAA